MVKGIIRPGKRQDMVKGKRPDMVKGKARYGKGGHPGVKGKIIYVILVEGKIW
jgi:hypothetical protein